MKGVIRLGDPTSHGGAVLAASSQVTVMGRLVALKGDPCVCPMPGHAGCVIAEGHPTISFNGVPVAFDGHKTSCGATLISTIPTSGSE